LAQVSSASAIQAFDRRNLIFFSVILSRSLNYPDNDNH